MQLRKFFVKLIVLLVVLFALDYGIGLLMQKFYFAQTSGLLYRTNYSLNQNKSEILILGSSRANHHYHPEVFKDSLKLTYYNAGRDGHGIFYHYAILKSTIKRYQPKIVILDLNLDEFRINNETYDRLATLLPYYKTNPELEDILLLKSPNERLKLVSRIYPYNSLLFSIAAANVEFDKKKKSDASGYVPLETGDVKLLRKELKKNKSYGYRLNNTDTIKIKYFEHFLQNCDKAGIKLYVIISPYLCRKIQIDRSISIADSLCSLYKIPLLNYSYIEGVSDYPQLFKDRDHLNDASARVFSEIAASYIIHFK